jgi:two-component system, NarL family, sensor kinase
MQNQINEIVIFFIVITILILTLAGFIIAILYFYQKKQIQFQTNLEALKSHYEKNLLRSQLEIQEQTLQNVSREIHDNIGLTLTLAKLNLNTLPNEFGGEGKEKFNAAIMLITQAIAGLSNLSKSLNSDYITHHGFVKALDREILMLRGIGNYQVEYSFAGNAVYMDSQKELLIFRIIQEGLNNILKHANGNVISIGVCYGKEDLRLSIIDNGVGFNPDEVHFKNSGLNNMRQRAKMLNGSCNISSAPNQGTSINVQIPY